MSRNAGQVTRSQHRGLINFTLQGVSISVSQLNKNDKNLLRKTVETHGGSYSGVLDMEKTSVLVRAWIVSRRS